MTRAARTCAPTEDSAAMTRFRPAPWPAAAKRVLALLLAVAGAPAWAADGSAPGTPDPGAPLPYVVGLHEAYLTPQYWAARLPTADAVILDRAQIDAQNARMRAEDASIHDLRALPAQLPRAQVLAAVQALSKWPEKTLYGVDGKPLGAAQRTASLDNLALAAIPAQRALQYGLVTHRAALRAFPTSLRVFTTQGDTDIDRFQESALFPATR